MTSDSDLGNGPGPEILPVLLSDRTRLPSWATVLTAWSKTSDEPQVLAKTWGASGCRPYDKAKRFTSRVADFSSVFQIYQRLRGLADDPHSCIIRGAIVPLQDPEDPHPRWSKDNERGEHTYDDILRSWVLIDIDGRQWTADTRQGALGVGHEARTTLPEPWRSGACVAKLSSSAGMKKTTGVHLWYSLKQPVGGEVLRPILLAMHESHGVDPALAGTVQPHYTANPLFTDGVVDPIPADLRLAALDGVDAVDISEQIAFGERQAAIERKRSEILKRERELAALRRRISGTLDQRKATCEEVAEHAGIITRVDGGILYCDCRVHRSQSGESLHVDLSKNCWHCFGCQLGGTAWDLAAHLLSTRGMSSRGDVIGLLKEVAREHS